MIIHPERKPLHASEAFLRDALWSYPVGILILPRLVDANHFYHRVKVMLHILELHTRSFGMEIRIAIRGPFQDLSRWVGFYSRVSRQRK